MLQVCRNLVLDIHLSDHMTIGLRLIVVATDGEEALLRDRERPRSGGWCGCRLNLRSRPHRRENEARQESPNGQSTNRPKQYGGRNDPHGCLPLSRNYSARASAEKDRRYTPMRSNLLSQRSSMRDTGK